MRTGVLVAVLRLLLAEQLPILAQPVVAGQPTGGSVLAVPAGGHTGFSRMASSATGVSFTNRLAEARIAENRLIEDGSGVAAGDVDGDGWCDLYFCGLDGPNVLYRNLGNWRFEDVTAAAGVACAGQHSTGTVLADVDGDGDLDLLVTALGKGTRCFLNDGRGQFREAADCGLIRQYGSRSLALADMDGDGDLDLYVTNYRTTTVRDSPVNVRLRQVGGRWEVPAEHRERFIAQETTPGTVALLEWGEPDAFYLNLGGGRFEALSWTGGQFLDEDGTPLASPPRDWGLTAMFRDINGDGWPDLYVCNDYFTPDRVWVNQGKGVFRALARLALRKTCYAAMSVDFGDLNRDGFDEIYVTEMLSRDPVRRQVQHSLLELSPMPMWGWGWPRGAIETRVQVMRNTLALNRGDGTYAEIAQFSGLQASEWTWGVAFCDVDLDGFEDILIANGHGRDLANSDALAAMDRLPKAVDPVERLKTLHLFPPLKLPHLLFRNRGDLTFEEVGHAWGFDVVGVANGMVLADLDNDGDLDVVLNNLNEEAVLLRNDSSAPRLAVRLKGARGNTQGIGARIRVLGGPVAQSQEVISGGRYLSGADPLRTFATGTATNLAIEVIWPGGGRTSVVDGVQANRLYVVDEAGARLPGAAAGTGPAGSTASASVMAAGPEGVRPAFAEAVGVLRHVHQEAGFDDFERQPLLPRRLSGLGPGVAWCDVNGDGREDLVIGSGRGGRLGVYLNQAGKLVGVETPAWKEAAGDDLTGVVGWSNEAGSGTLLVGKANYESGETNGVAVMRYEVFFGDVQAVAAAGGWESSVGPLAVADMDGDGDLDLFVGGREIGGRYPVGASSRVYRLEGGKYELDEDNSRRLAGVGLVSGAVWSDLDGDGYAELVLACEWGGVVVYRNRGGRLEGWDGRVEWGPIPSWAAVGQLKARPSSLKQMRGWWTGVNAGDLDGDGRLDLVVGNWGLNHKYRGVVGGGLRLYHGDADGNGVWDVVEGYWEGGLGKVVPWRDWRTMRGAIPGVGERFRSYGEYGRAGVEEVLGEGYGRMVEMRAEVLESVVLLNRGEVFECRVLPLEAQLAPVFGVCIGDYDGDGREDVFLSQNFFGTDAESGRYDGGRGLWLRGDGAGGVAVVSGEASGVRVYGEGRGAALGDYDGDGRVDLVVSQNGGETRLYRNDGGKAGLRVRLVGGGGNGSGLGAVVQVGWEGGWGPVREVHGGGGYWSQDSAVVVLGVERAASRIRVRWPGGRVVEGKVPAGAREVRVSAEGQIEAVD